jgi:hypothetical protein
MKHSNRDLLLGAMLLALALIFPILFHAVGLGSSFLPMFYPILIAGFLIDLPVASAVGFLAPLLSAFFTGMPPFFPPVAFIMMAEGLVLAALPALLYQKWGMKILPVLIVTIVVDRAVLLVAVIVSARWLSLPEGVLGLASLVRGLPGIILIIFFVPPLVKKMEEKLRFFPKMR